MSTTTTSTSPSRPPAPFLSSSAKSSSTSKLLSQRISVVKLQLNVDAGAPAAAAAADGGASTAPSAPDGSFQSSLNEMVQSTTGLMTAPSEGGDFASALEDLALWQKTAKTGDDKQVEYQADAQSTETKNAAMRK